VQGGIVLLIVPTLAGCHARETLNRGREVREMGDQVDVVLVAKTGDREITLTGTFAVPRRRLFDALTRPEHLEHWMNAGGMSLAEAHVDGRAGGSFRYVFRRPNGRTIEVHGAYSAFDSPCGVAYLESYDFSPLRIDVTRTLHETDGGARLTQNLRYVSTHERDEDFDGVSTSSREAFAKLARYLEESRKPVR
jgi:uncharacterized protein YndB with AHSA1/START domain